jgi:polysaccharide export outer membrane protein
MGAGVLLKLCAVALAVATVVGCGSAPPQPVPSSAAAPSTPEYKIGPGDQLQVFVFNRPELTTSIPVRPDGLISTPLVEDMPAAGKTPTQLARDVEVRLAEYVRSPKVNIIVTSFKGELSEQIRVAGQGAAKPQALAYRSNMTLLDVMIEVGGLSEFAAGNRARIVRQIDGKNVDIKVRLQDLMEGDIRHNVPVMPGDVIIIPESRF